MAPPRASRPFAPCLCFTLLLLAAPSSWAQDSDELKLAALEERAALKAAEEEQARLLAKEEEAKFKDEEAKMKTLADDAAKKTADAERLVKEAAEEEKKKKTAEARLKSLQYEKGKLAVEQESAKRAAEAEKTAFKTETAKFKSLSQDAAKKGAERKAIEEEEARLIAKMNEKSAGDDDKDRRTGRVLSPQVPPHAGTGDVFTKLANAKAAGLDSKEYEPVAAKARKAASEELKQAVADKHQHQNMRRLRDAFQNAEKAGVPDKEHSDARASVMDTAGKRLAKAHAAANVTTSANIQELAEALSVGHSAGLDREVLQAATRTYEKQAKVALAHKDLRHVEVFVKYRHTADAQIDSTLVSWVKFMNKIKGAASTMTEDTPYTRTILLGMVTEAKGMGFPNNTDLAVVEKRVQAWSSSHLKNSSKAVNMTQSDFQELLKKVENGREAGITSSDLTAASQQVLSFARSQLNDLCGAQARSYDGGKLKGAFIDAERASVPEAEREAARNKVIAGIKKQLTTLTSPSSNSSATRSQELVGDLKHAITLGGRFGIVEAEIINARNFYSKQCEKAVSENNLIFAEALVDNSRGLDVNLPDKVKSWARMWKKLREARKIPSDQKNKLQSLLDTVIEAKNMGLPNSSDFANVTEKVKTWAAAELKEASSNGGNFTSDGSFIPLLRAVQQAKSAGVTSTELKAADAKVHSWASSKLTAACKTKPYNPGNIKTAFHNAEQAGVSEEIRTKAHADLRADVERQLIAASSNVSKASRNADFVGKLAESLSLAARFGVNETVRTNARNFYEAQGKIALEEKDFHYAELLIQSRKQADAVVPDKLITWVKVLKQLREAENMPVGRTDQLPALLEMINTAKSVGLDNKNKHLAAVEATAKKMASADLKAEL